MMPAKDPIIIEFNNLPKISNNKFYAGLHWAVRKKIKDEFATTVFYLWKQQSKDKFDCPCNVEYHFEFKNKPLDCSNAIGMVKMIEDVLFKDDSPNIVKSIKISSKKSDRDRVIVKILAL